eukprot:gnl/MRDRNA2_/MRDRNA2_84393_c0_seq1.p1 gnl/MRDRNA2_/MRDRNA2_84393_c0~~gnl/MRDRNA2_/MRDRNA2_84393_c0_seq1.p1  ORF type:complete len:329 (+),score=50.87 gnl/MRDRNA2_/MRDRNA2_84393_c0_seq1:135-1121(+)
MTNCQAEPWQFKDPVKGNRRKQLLTPPCSSRRVEEEDQIKRSCSRQFIECVGAGSSNDNGCSPIKRKSGEIGHAGEEEQIKRISSMHYMEIGIADDTGSDAVTMFGLRCSKVTLRNLWMKTIILSDTQLGRDKSARFLQYCGRMISGLTGSTGVPWLLCMNLALMRRCLRFWKPVKLAKQIEDTAHDENMAKLDKVLTLTEFSSFLVYCLMDHLRFAQNCSLLKLSPERYDILDRLTETLWVCETVPALTRETLALFRSNGSVAKRTLARKWVLKLLCDLFCAVHFTWPIGRRNQRIHKIWVGLLGAVASLMSLHIAWPSDSDPTKSP